MALAISKPTSYGVAATYWRVIHVEADFRDRRMKVFVGGYVDQDARDAANQPMSTVIHVFEGALFVEEPTRAMVYAALKSWEERSGDGSISRPWQGAKDI